MRSLFGSRTGSLAIGTLNGLVAANTCAGPVAGAGAGGGGAVLADVVEVGAGADVGATVVDVVGVAESDPDESAPLPARSSGAYVA